MSGHSIYSPSGAERWLNCRASIPSTEGMKSKSSKASEEGIYAHELGATSLSCKLDVRDCLNFVDEKECPKTELFDEEMITNVQTYVDTIKSMSKGEVIHRGVEFKLDLSNVIGVKDQVGTADYLLHIPGEIQVHDLKYGRGPVKANYNKQLMLYALGYIDHLELMYGVPEDTKVRLVIHQPRLNTVSEWLTDLYCLNEFKKEVQDKVKVIEDIRIKPCELNPEDFNPSEKTCYWCLNMGNCEACTEFNIKQTSEMFDGFPTSEEIQETTEKEIKNISKLSGERQAAVYDNFKLFTKWQEAFKDQFLADLLNGKDIPGYKAVLGSSTHKAWKDKKEAEEALKKRVRLKQDEMYTKKLCTPTQALKIVKGKKFKTDIVTDLFIPGQKRPTIATIDDKREAVIENISDELENISDDFDLFQ